MAAMCALYDASHAGSKLVVHPHDPDRDLCTVRVTANTAGWRYVGSEVLRVGAVVRCGGRPRDVRGRPLRHPDL